MRGGSTACRLQKPTQTKTATLADTTTWEDVTTFTGSLQPVSVQEMETYGREAVIATHKLIFMSNDIGKEYITEVKAKNRVVVNNAYNELGADTYDVTGVKIWRDLTGRKIQHFTVALKVVE